jgi:hypothetical protein
VNLVKFLFPNPLASTLEVPQNFESKLKSLQDQIYSLVKRIPILEDQRNQNIFSDISKISQKLPSNEKHGDIRLNT